MTAVAIKSFKCTLCEQYKGERHLSVTVSFADTSVSNYACDTCAQEMSESRKYESCEAAILSRLSNEDMADDFMSNEGWGYMAVLGNWILTEDPQGFVDAEDHGTVEKAQTAFHKYHDEGWGYSEYDAQISVDRGRYYVYFDNKQIACLLHEDWDNPLRRAKAIVSVEMRHTGYYPNVWLSDEYGTMERIDVW